MFFNSPVKFEETHYHGMPDKFFDKKEKKYVDLSDAKEISREHGSFWGTHYPYDYGDWIKLMSDVGATCLILKKDSHFYLVVKNQVHNGLWMQKVEDVHIGECATLDEAQYYAEEQKSCWTPTDLHRNFWQKRAQKYDRHRQ